MTAIRICFNGDSILLGIGDPGYDGWPAIAAKAEAGRGHDITVYNLGVRGDTSAGIAPRWAAECHPRILDFHNGALVFAFGLNDTAEVDGTGIRVSLDQSVGYAREMLSGAKAWLPTLWVGPIPVVEDMQPYMFPDGLTYDYRNDRVAAVNAAFAEVAGELDVPYLDVFTPLSANPAFDDSQRGADGVHVGTAGYALIADMVDNWPAWRALFD